VPKAGDEVTVATGGGTTVVDGALDELLDDDAAELAELVSAAVTPAGLTPAVPVCTAVSPVDEPEHAVLTASTPTAIRATAARRADLERCKCIRSSGDRQQASKVGDAVVVLVGRTGSPNVDT
jgi:hypothetical protein